MRGLIVCVLCATPLLVWAESLVEYCNRQLPPAQVEVRTALADPSISFEMSAAQIEQMARTGRTEIHLGLTQVETHMEPRVAFAILSSAAGQRLCARPRIEVTLALDRARVHVARELVGDECAVAAVWHHELRHFAIVQESLASTASELERMMRAYYDGAVLLGSEAEARGQIEREFRGRWASEFETLQARGNLAHEALDAQEAQAESTVCDGALARLASRLSRKTKP
jgi:hypothetical protein